MEKLYDAINYLEFLIAHIQDNEEFQNSDGYMLQIKPATPTSIALSYTLGLQLVKNNFKDHHVTFEYNDFIQVYELKFRRRK